MHKSKSPTFLGLVAGVARELVGAFTAEAVGSGATSATILTGFTGADVSQHTAVVARPPRLTHTRVGGA